MNAAAILVFAASATAVVVLLLAWVLRLRRRERQVLAELSPRPDEQPAAAAARLREQATLCGELPRLETRLDNLLRASPLPLILVDGERRIIALSASAEEELDQPRRRRGLLESLQSHDIDELVRQALEQGGPVETVVRLHAAGRRPFRVRLFPYRNQEQRECLIFLENLAEQVDYGRMRSQFAATVSHELRTPLAGIRALAESLGEKDLGDEDRRRFLGRLEAESSRLARLIDELLFLSELESGPGMDLRGDVPLQPLVAEVLAELRPLAERSEVQLENRVGPGVRLPLEARMARTVITNLVDNAVKYSGRGSRVEIGAEKQGDRVRVTVSDDGVGIDAEHLPHVFERFYRVDKSRSRHLGGTGLGLSIVKHIVENAGGEVEAESREGFGTSIKFILPL